MNFGDWEGMSWEQIEQLDPEYAQEWMAAYPHLPAPSGESFEAFEARVLEEVNHLLDRNPGPIAVVDACRGLARSFAASLRLL